MPWFKVDDKLHDHRKARRASKAAMGVWVLAGSWAADNLTDGFVPASVLSRWGTRRDAAQLVDADLWQPAERDGEPGWQFRSWDEYQPSKADVEAEREANRERLRKWREKRRKNASGNSSSNAVTNAVSNALPDPTRPDPTPVPNGTGGPRKRAVAIPDDWAPSNDHRKLAAELGVGCDLEAKQFRDHAIAKGRTLKDWDAGFRNWLRQAAKFGGGKAIPFPNRPDDTSWMRRRPGDEWTGGS